MEEKNLNIYQIVEGEGLGDLKFGLQKDQVVSILGEPDEKENYSHTDTEQQLTETWHYDELEISLGFDQDDNWRLGTISVTAPDFKFRDFSPTGLTKKELEQNLVAAGINDLKIEDSATVENIGHELLYSNLLGINFWFEKDSLTEVQWGPLFIDEETIQWPKL